MGNLRRVLGVTLHDKEHRSEIGKARVVKSLVRMERSQIVSSAMCPECPRKDWRSRSFGLQSTPTGKRPRGRQGPGGVTTSVLAWSRLGVEPPLRYGSDQQYNILSYDNLLRFSSKMLIIISM